MCSPRVEEEDFGWSEILEDNSTPQKFSRFWFEEEGS